MINIKATMTIILRVIVEAMRLYITWCIDGVIQLDSSPMEVGENVKSIPITLNIFLNSSLNKDIVVVDLPPLFGICLSREFTTKLGCYLALDYTHLPLHHKDKYVKIPNEGTKFVHIGKISKQICMNAHVLVETYDQDPLIESLLTTKILSDNDLDY